MTEVNVTEESVIEENVTDVHGVDAHEEVLALLSDLDKEILRYINGKVGSFVTEMQDDIKNRGYELKLKFNIAFAPIERDRTSE